MQNRSGFLGLLVLFLWSTYCSAAPVHDRPADPSLLSQLDAPLLFVKRHPYFSAHIYDDYNTWHPGGGVYILDNPSAPPGEHRVRALIDATTTPTLGNGVYRDPDLSWDGKRLVFCYKSTEHGDTSIYEMAIDGTGLRRLSDPGQACSKMPPQIRRLGAGQHDITPCYLPSGRIAFTSTRSQAKVMCFNSLIDVLHTMDADGADVRCISVNNVNEFDPSVLPDGRLLYGRWEYVDKTALYMQSLWTSHPDGSNETAFFANNLAKPTALLDARPVPGTELVVAALTPHNGQSVGAIAMIDPRMGKNNLDAIFNFTPKYPTKMDQGLKRGPSDPWPLSKDTIVIANNDPECGPHGVIEIIDRFGHREQVIADPKISCYSPMLIKARDAAPALPSMIQPDKPARFLIQDIYRGLTGVKRGEVKRLRVIEETARVSGIPPGGRWWNQAFLVSWQGAYAVKNFLGEVPVLEDGSAYFEAPPGKALYFQALDEQGKLVQSQRTFVQAVPGTTRSCMGCHTEDEDQAPHLNRKLLAQTQDPAKLKPESWGIGFVDYPTMVQPILDQHCVRCHGGQEGMAAGMDLSGGWTWAFNISYETLLKNTLTGFLNCNNGNVQTSEILAPRTHGSGAAPLAELLLSGHDGQIPDLTKKERDLLLVWMDGNSNYYGTWDWSEQATCDVLLSAGKQLAELMKAADCARCHAAVVGNDWVNLQAPDHSRILRAPMPKSDAGLGLAICRSRKARAVWPLVQQRGAGSQPPDVFRPKKTSPANPDGVVVTSFGTANDPTYKKMLAVIERAHREALAAPRVDMPGAEVHRGEIRQLVIGPETVRQPVE